MTTDDVTASQEWSADLADAEFARLVKDTKVITPLTRALLVVLVAAAGFIGGVLVERTQQPAATASVSAASAFRGGQNANAGGGAPGGGATVGTITLIDGTNVYVTTAQGDVVKVLTNPQTTISVSKNGTLADLDPAKTVVVQGATNADGTVTASQITQGGFGAFGGGGGRRGSGTAGGGGGNGARGGQNAQSGGG
ncbi:MAG TPA: hypothetical protein VJ831_06390 [Jatrophihabitantaceae bacterium]|nr:hypothetical protein [Jatrophihabitantaceae bacterium]